MERHHNQKVDSPSGTALALADSINEAMDNVPGMYRYGSYTSTSSSGSKFSFRNIFSMLKNIIIKSKILFY